MKNLFSVFTSQNTTLTAQQPAVEELNDQDLEQVTGASGGGYDYGDDYDYYDYDDYYWYDSYGHRHHERRRRHHNKHR